MVGMVELEAEKYRINFYTTHVSLWSSFSYKSKLLPKNIVISFEKRF